MNHSPRYSLLSFQQPNTPANQQSIFSPLTNFQVPPTPTAPGSNINSQSNPALFSIQTVQQNSQQPLSNLSTVENNNAPGNSVLTTLQNAENRSIQPSSSTSEVVLSNKPATPASAESPGIIPQLQNIVCTVNLGCRLDLKKIAMKARNAEYNPKRFAAVIMRIREPRTTALIFSSGKMVCTGAKSEDSARLAARKYARIIQKLGFDAKFLDFKIQNMVGSCDVKFPLRLEGFVFTHSQFTSYEPELFPGLIYRMFKPKIVLLIFVSGKIVLTGAKERSQINEAFGNIYPILKQFRKP